MLTKGRQQEIILERALVARSRRGDRGAFGELFALYRRPIFRLCLDRLGDPSLAEDAVQDTFVRAFRALPNFDARRRFFPWLATIASNRAEDLRRRERRQQPAGLVPDINGVAIVSDVAAAVIERQRLNVALSALPPLQRRMVLRHDVEGWSCAEVADLEGKSELAVRSSLCRARAILRALLRTLGLTGVMLRSWRRRTREYAEKLASQSGSDLVGATVVSAGVLAVSAVSLILAVTLDSGDPSTRSKTPAFAAVRSALQADVERPPAATVKRDDVPSQPSDNERAVGPLKVTPKTKPSRPGAAAPRGGKVRVEVVDPQGHPVYYNDTWLECDEEAGRIPNVPNSPIRTVC